MRDAIGVCSGSQDFIKQANEQDKGRPCGQTQQRSKYIYSEVIEEEKRSGWEIIVEIGKAESSEYIRPNPKRRCEVGARAYSFFKERAIKR